MSFVVFGHDADRNIVVTYTSDPPVPETSPLQRGLSQRVIQTPNEDAKTTGLFTFVTYAPQAPLVVKYPWTRSKAKK